MHSVRFSKPELPATQRGRSVSGRERWQRFADVAVAGFLLVLILPLALFVVAAIICENPGPILERRLCVGRNGRQFRLLTFRTTELQEYSYAFPRRVSNVGKFLRYTRIDALPELINVLWGDICIAEVGVLD
jgi:lipopolysaccharide/colanic/teichoic acid biosynthesis glycosyltransferase